MFELPVERSAYCISAKEQLGVSRSAIRQQVASVRSDRGVRRMDRWRCGLGWGARRKRLSKSGARLNGGRGSVPRLMRVGKRTTSCRSSKMLSDGAGPEDRIASLQVTEAF